MTRSVACDVPVIGSGKKMAHCLRAMRSPGPALELAKRLAAHRRDLAEVA